MLFIFCIRTSLYHVGFSSVDPPSLVTTRFHPFIIPNAPFKGFCPPPPSTIKTTTTGLRIKQTEFLYIWFLTHPCKFSLCTRKQRVFSYCWVYFITVIQIRLDDKYLFKSISLIDFLSTYCIYYWERNFENFKYNYRFVCFCNWLFQVYFNMLVWSKYLELFSWWLAYQCKTILF